MSQQAKGLVILLCFVIFTLGGLLYVQTVRLERCLADHALVTHLDAEYEAYLARSPEEQKAYVEAAVKRSREAYRVGN